MLSIAHSAFRSVLGSKQFTRCLPRACSHPLRDLLKALRVQRARVSKIFPDTCILRCARPEQHRCRTRRGPGGSQRRQRQCGLETSRRHFTAWQWGVQHRQHVVDGCQSQRALRPETEVAGMHVGVGNESAEPPQAPDSIHIVGIDQARLRKAAREPRPVGRSVAQQRCIDRGQAVRKIFSPSRHCRVIDAAVGTIARSRRAPMPCVKAGQW